MSVASLLPPAVTELQKTLTYQFSHSPYLLEALRMAGTGYSNLYAPSSVEGNKRLAHLGDAVLRMILLDLWYANGADRGVASVKIATVASATYLSHFATRINLPECILVNPSHGQAQLSDNVIARSVQALVGALWLDSERNLTEISRVLDVTQFWDMDQSTL